ncbi:MAG: hypothetical protein QM770_21745 [Tepidisphaeraceae bacterium]
MSASSFNVRRAHQWFAIELNNLAWDLVEANERSPADAERMIHAAHGACFHWLEVGELVNHLRAQCLLAAAYAKASLAESAVRHAEQCLRLSREAGDKQSAFDRASAHGCASNAYTLAGRMDDARTVYERALEAAKGFDDPDDRPVFERLFPRP